MKACALILSGGKSSRMGTNKALLEIDGKTTIERIRDELQTICDDLILVTNEPETYRFLNLKIVADEFPGKGPLAGIHTGLKASDFEVNFVTACDMPFVSAELAAALIQNIGHYDAVIPVIEGKQHPLFAVYKKAIAADVEQCLENGILKIRDLLENLNVLYLTEQDLQGYCDVALDLAFFNMNHPEEYENAKKRANPNR